MPYKDLEKSKKYHKEYCQELWLRKKTLKKNGYVNCKLCDNKMFENKFYCNDCFTKICNEHKPWHKGKKCPAIGSAKLGDKNPMWKGGITSKSRQLKNSPEWKNWRYKVFKRDNFICQDCNQKGKKLHPHHIFEKSKYPNFIFKVWNGRTLCSKCHKKTYYKEEKYREDLFAKFPNSVKIPMLKVMDNAELNLSLLAINV
uniref:Putative HNH endonuclease n=1 Tax=viral metagenome TaxID=1070528 RepID=A0A6M3ISN5_9ZZZZ